MRLLTGFLMASVALAAPSAAQRQATAEQRIDRLEKQLRQVQGRVFQRGQPVDTAGFDYEPAAPLSAVSSVSERLGALERQLSDIQRISEENGNRLRSIEADAARARTEQAERIAVLERRLQELTSAPVPAAGQPSASSGEPIQGPVPVRTPVTTTTSGNSAGPNVAPAADPGEDAYTEGFKLWQAGRYEDAIASLRRFVSAYPGHRRISWANNLIGRSLLDSGQPREAATALLANYRANPKGERAADSLYYLGQSLMKLGQPSQACNAYGELEAIYGDKVRADLKKLVTQARSEAQCR